jgi:two-component system, NtrC family, sensor histidine kinase PilS
MVQGWLSTIWEANWRSFQYFNLYRLLLASLCLLALLFPSEWTLRLNLRPSLMSFVMVGTYVAASAAGLLLARLW